METITTLKGKSSLAECDRSSPMFTMPFDMTVTMKLLQEYVYQIWGTDGSDLHLGLLGYGTM
jgi:hypothetical protein